MIEKKSAKTEKRKKIYKGRAKEKILREKER